MRQHCLQLQALHALLQDATRDIVLWLNQASAEERVWVSETQSLLTDLQRSLERRIEGRSPNDESKRWKHKVDDFLICFENAKEVRGAVVGRNLAKLSSQLKSHSTRNHLGNNTDGVTPRKASPNAPVELATPWRSNSEEYDVANDNDRAAISVLDEQQTREALSHYGAGISQALTRIAALEQELARGGRNERRLLPIKHSLRDAQERHKKLLRLSGLASQRLRTLSGGDYDKEHNAAGKTEEQIFIPSEDYRSIKYKGTVYKLTRNQATIIRLLHQACLKGTPALGKHTLLSAIEAETSRVRDSFKGSPLWGTLIVSNSRPRGTCQLTLK